MRHTTLALSLGVLLIWTGCQTQPQADLMLPASWIHDGEARWWTEGADTLAAFKPMETLGDLDVVIDDIVFELGVPLAQQTRVNEASLLRYVKRALIPLFRNEPVIVDSLFEAYVAPKVRESAQTTDPAAAVSRFKREGYRIIARHFREPRTILALGTDVPVIVPDSLRFAGNGRAVEIQVRLSDTGEPVALRQLTEVHPVLDRIAMVATTRMRWQPAYVLSGQKAIAVPAWARFRVRFN